MKLGARRAVSGAKTHPSYPFKIGKLRGEGKKILLITGRYDPTFLPEFTNALLDKIRDDGVPFKGVSLPCGHYSMGVAPFSYLAGYRFGKFLAKSLA